MRKSITSRIKITRSGKIRRRAMGLCHGRSNKSRKELSRKKKMRGLVMKKTKITRHL